MLELRAVGKTFFDQVRSENLVALESVSLDVPDRQFICLLGPSGCGKTTLIRLVAGLIRADEGVIRVEGKEIRAPRPECSIVFQNYGLLPWRTVQQNVELGLQ